VLFGGVPLPTAHCPLLTAHCPLPTAHCSLPTAHCPLPTAHCSLFFSVLSTQSSALSSRLKPTQNCVICVICNLWFSPRCRWRHRLPSAPRLKILSEGFAMKRCPRCEFVYENEQSRCDMDGTGLVYDPRPLTPEGRAATEPTALLVKSRRRISVVPSVVGVLFVSVLLIGYYGFTHRSAPRISSPSPSKLTTAPQSDSPMVPLPAATATPAPSPGNEATPHKKKPEKTSRINTVSSAHSSSARKRQDDAPDKPIPSRTIAKNQPRERTPARTNANKDSRIRSFFKNTARVLKKPFQL
jgi:hypothetical protein